MKIFLKKSAAFFISGLLIAFMLQWVIDTGIKKSDYSEAYKDWYELMHAQIKAGIVIQGSSRARVQISPKAFEASFKLSTYNLGMDGSPFPEQLYKYHQYIKYNNKPTYIIQVVDPNFLSYNNAHFVQYIPYLTEDYLKAFKGHSMFSKADLYIPLYKYRHTFGITSAGLINFAADKPIDNGSYKGYHPFNFYFNVTKTPLTRPSQRLKTMFNDTVYRQFMGFAAYCKKEHIKLILVYPPSLLIFQNDFIDKNAIPGMCADISKKYGFPFLDYSKDKVYQDTSLLFDYAHLNIKGTTVFNKQLVQDLRPYIK